MDLSQFTFSRVNEKFFVLLAKREKMYFFAFFRGLVHNKPYCGDFNSGAFHGGFNDRTSKMVQ